VIFAELFSIYFILWAGHNYIDTEQLNPANHWTYLLSRCSVIGWFHVLFCLEFGVPSTTVKTTAYSGSIATLVHHSHQLKVFTFQPLKSQAPLHLDPLISHTLWHSSPDILTLSLEVSHLAVVVTGCCENVRVHRSSKQLKMWATVSTFSAVRASVSCLISVHVHFRYCGLFTGDFLLACFVTELLVEVIVTCDFLLGTLVHLVQIENQSEKLNIKSCSVCDSSPSCFWKTEVYKHRIHFNNHLGLVI